MSDNVIVDTARDYILQNVDHLRIALHVEQALPGVKESMICGFIESLIAKLKEINNGKPSADWEINFEDKKKWSGRGVMVSIRKPAWKVFEDEYKRYGVVLGTDGDLWTNSYVGIICQDYAEYPRISEGVRQAFCRTPKRYSSYWPAYESCKFGGRDMRNWTVGDVLRDFHPKSPSRDELVEKTASRLWEIAEIVQPAFDECVVKHADR